MLKSQKQGQKKQTLKTRLKPSTKYIMIICKESNKDTTMHKKPKNLQKFQNSKKQPF